MNIFGKKEIESIGMAYPPYWSDFEFSSLTDKLTSDWPYLGFEISNASHRLDLGSGVADHNRDHGFSNQLSLYGRMTGPSAEFECKFHVLPDEIEERTYHGYVVVESCSTTDGKMYPKISAKFNVHTDDEIERLRRATQPALTQMGKLYLTLRLQRIASLPEWVEKFSSENFAPSITITGLTISSSLSDRLP